MNGYMCYDPVSDFEGIHGSVSLFAKDKLLALPFFNEVIIARNLFDDNYSRTKLANVQVVYLMFNQIDNLYKIGRTKNLPYRERTLQGQQPRVELIAFWEREKSFEKRLHYHFGSKKVRGEWFKLSFADLLELKALAESN